MRPTDGSFGGDWFCKTVKAVRREQEIVFWSRIIVESGCIRDLHDKFRAAVH